MKSRPDHASSPLKNSIGEFVLHVFSWGGLESDNIFVLEKPSVNEPQYVRVHSACYTGEVFGSVDCDCDQQLTLAMQTISNLGGFIIYLQQDGRGAGSLNKIRGMHLTFKHGIDTVEAYKKMGIDVDQREYSKAIWVLRHFGVTNMHLLTNNPRKIEVFEAAGFSVFGTSHETSPTDANRDYLRVKKDKMGHTLQKV